MPNSLKDNWGMFFCQFCHSESNSDEESFYLYKTLCRYAPQSDTKGYTYSNPHHLLYH